MWFIFGTGAYTLIFCTFLKRCMDAGSVSDALKALDILCEAGTSYSELVAANTGLVLKLETLAGGSLSSYIN
jgi:hypothetical protein